MKSVAAKSPMLILRGASTARCSASTAAARCSCSPPISGWPARVPASIISADTLICVFYAIVARPRRDSDGRRQTDDVGAGERRRKRQARAGLERGLGALAGQRVEPVGAQCGVDAGELNQRPSRLVELA